MSCAVHGKEWRKHCKEMCKPREAGISMNYTIDSDDPKWEMVTSLVKERDRLQKRYLRLRGLMQDAMASVPHYSDSANSPCLKCLIHREMDFPELNDDPEPENDPMVINMVPGAAL